MGPQEISENGSPSTFWTTSRDGLFGVKSKEEDPLRLKTSVIFPWTLFICSRATNPGVFPGLENVFQIRLQICWEPQISWPLLTLLHHCTSSISPPISSDHSVLWVFFFFFQTFIFHWFSGRQIGFLKKSWLTERKGTGIMFSEAQRT